VNELYFISDIHLSFELNDSEKIKRKKLIDFLESITKKNNKLYIIGDLFDFWFEWYNVIPYYWSDILFELKKSINNGLEVNFITGNHDFFCGNYLKDEIGMKCFDSEMIVNFDNKRFYVSHGDGFAKKDRGYRFLKRIIRNKFSIFMFKTFIHPALGIKIAKLVSKSSREYKKIDVSKWSKEYELKAREILDKGFDYVILAHIHTPYKKEFKDNKIYINTGDWINHFTYAVYSNKSLLLKHF